MRGLSGFDSKLVFSSHCERRFSIALKSVLNDALAAPSGHLLRQSIAFFRINSPPSPYKLTPLAVYPHTPDKLDWAPDKLD